METQLYKGLPASPGQCVARVEVLPKMALAIPEIHVENGQVEVEIDRLKNSLTLAVADVERLKARVEKRLNRMDASIFDAHLAMLQDTFFTSEMQMMIRQFSFRAETAVHKTLVQFIGIFESIQDEYLRERSLDMKDVGYRLLNKLLEKQEWAFSTKKSEIVLIAEELLPSQICHAEADRLKGIIVSEGGMQSHTAILARAMGIPMICGLNAQQMQDMHRAKIVKMDGASGLIEVSEEEYCSIY